jgi:hypothetical protein
MASGPKEKVVKRLVVSLCALVALSGTAYSVSAADDATGAVSAVKGNMLVSANGARLAPVYRVGADGSPQIIIEGRLVTIPATTLSMSGGKLTTSLTKSEVLALH